MAVVGESNDVFAYTKEWLSKVNRGGLFPLNDETFRLFIEIEKCVRILLKDHILEKSQASEEDFQQDVIVQITGDENVQFQWILISQCIDCEKHAGC